MQTHVPRRAHSRSGFTLIEVTIAVTVLLVAVLSTFLSQISANDLLRQARETNTASADLQATLERVLTRGVEQIPVQFPPGAELATTPSLRDQSIVASYPGYVAGTAVPDPLTIVLTATWTDHRGGARSLRLSTLKTR